MISSLPRKKSGKPTDALIAAVFRKNTHIYKNEICQKVSPEKRDTMNLIFSYPLPMKKRSNGRYNRSSDIDFFLFSLYWVKNLIRKKYENRLYSLGSSRGWKKYYLEPREMRMWVYNRGKYQYDLSKYATWRNQLNRVPFCQERSIRETYSRRIISGICTRPHELLWFSKKWTGTNYWKWKISNLYHRTPRNDPSETTPRRWMIQSDHHLSSPAFSRRTQKKTQMKRNRNRRRVRNQTRNSSHWARTTGTLWYQNRQ